VGVQYYNENEFHFLEKNDMLRSLRIFPVLLTLAFYACSPTALPEASQGAQSGDKLKVVATTSIIGDVVKNIGGEAIDVSVLIPTDSDPHSFEPVPQDLARLSDADLIFANGAGLEEQLLRVVENAAGGTPLVTLTTGTQLIDTATDQDHPQATAADTDHEQTSGDPHVWTDPNLVKVWADTIAKNLSQSDPANAAQYQSNAEAYKQKLDELDRWIQEQVSQIPPEERKLVTDHLSFSYFAERYGLEQVGALIPSYSTLAEPSAQELARLEDAIRELEVKAIFVGRTVNPDLAARVAQDTGIQFISLYEGSLSTPGGEADSYLDYMRYNVQAIVSGLK
jgi:manganese/iron transport system substrate-binding protein